MPAGHRPSTASVTLTLATVSVLAAAAWWSARKNRRRPPKHDKNGSSRSNDAEEVVYPPPGVSPAVQHTFEQCAERIRHITDLSDGDKLFLYALYKQATVGDAPDSFSTSLQSSSWNVVAAQAKYYAWRKVQGMPRTGAFFQYIATVQMHIEDQMYEEKTDIVDNTTGRPITSTSPANSDMDEYDDDVDNGGHSTNGGGMMGVAVSRPVMMDDEDTTEPEDDSNEGIFLRAAAANDLVKVRQLIKDYYPSSLNLNHKDHLGQSAMHLAADHGAKDVLEYLLTNFGTEIYVDSADDDGISVLQAAVIAGQVEICRLLLKHGANPDLADDDGDTPRNCAADDGSEELKRLFVSTPIQNGSANGH